MTQSPDTLAGADLPGPRRDLRKRISNYVIIRLLGEGGMGSVFEAEQEKPQRRVALKVIRPGLASASHLRRFEQETQVLGRLHHPGIAQIYEAGTADTGQGPQPYFAMELIEGRSLLDYAEEHQLGTRQRLELMVKICEAVEHAHQKGVIHRDLKPGNILVDATGQPKILDFGVARSTDSDIQLTLQTDISQLVGTIPYMSPEQVSTSSRDLDTRSDVYALGVILYQLLAGRLPYDLGQKMIHEAILAIREEEPTRLSAINKVFRGDVETIVAHALEKNRTRRYQSATALAEDIGRYLKDEPIVARPASAIYQLRKFAHRNKALVGGVAAVFVALVAGTIVSTTLAVRARTAEALAASREQQADAQAREARREAAKAKAVRTFLQEMLASADPSLARGPEVTVREILDESSRKIEARGLESEPEIEAELRMTLGSTYRELGVYDRAELHVRPALALHERLYGAHSVPVADARRELASIMQSRGDYAGAEREVEAARALYKSLSQGESTDIATCFEIEAKLCQNRADLPGAEAATAEALALRRKIHGNEHHQVAGSLFSLAAFQDYAGKEAQAETNAREGLAILRRLPGPHHLALLGGLSTLSLIQMDRADFPGADQSLREARDLAQRIFGDEHPIIADVLWRKGSLLRRKRDLDAAEPVLRECIAMRRKLLGADHRDVATALSSLGHVQQQREDYDGAESLYREALEMRRRIFGEDHATIAASLTDLAALKRARKDWAEAERLLREALALWIRLLGEDTLDQIECRYHLGMLMQSKGEYQEAETMFRRNLELQRKAKGEGDQAVAGAMNTLASLLFRKGDASASEAMLHDALAIKRKTMSRGHPELLEGLANLAYVLDARGELAGAEALLREGSEMARESLPADHRETSSALARLGSNLTRQGRWEEAEVAIRDALAMRQRKLPAGHWLLADTKGLVGAVFVGRKEFGAAEPLLLESHALLTGNRDTPPANVKTAVERLVQLYEAWGKTEEVASWRAKLEGSGSKPSR